MADVQRVDVTFRLSPGERILYALVFWRPYRFVGLIGLSILALSFAPTFADARLPFLIVGALLTLGFIWLPFRMSLRSVERRYTATERTFAAAIDGRDSGDMAWRSFKKIRHSMGSVVLDLDGAGVVAIPLRAFGPGQLVDFESLAREGMRSAAQTEAPADAGEPAFSYHHEVTMRELLSRRVHELDLSAVLIVVFLPLSLGLVVVLTGDRAGTGLVAAGIVLGLWLALTTAIEILWTGFRRTHAGHSVVVYQSGYLLRGPAMSGWNPWSAFKAARFRGDDLILEMAKSPGHCHVSVAGLSAEQRTTLRQLITEAGIRWS